MNLLPLMIFSLLAGVAISLPLGPVGALILTNALRFGLPSAIAALVGLILGESVYIVLFYVGISERLLAHPEFQHPMLICGGVLLLWLGGKTLQEHRLETSPVAGVDHEALPVAPRSVGRRFFEAWVVTLSNPAILMIFASIIGSGIAILGEEAVRGHVLFILIGLEIGTVLFFLPVSALVARWGASLSEAWHRTIDRVAGFSLIGFGLWILLPEGWHMMRGLVL